MHSSVFNEVSVTLTLGHLFPLTLTHFRPHTYADRHEYSSPCVPTSSFPHTLMFTPASIHFSPSNQFLTLSPTFYYSLIPGPTPCQKLPSSFFHFLSLSCSHSQSASLKSNILTHSVRTCIYTNLCNWSITHSQTRIRSLFESRSLSPTIGFYHICIRPTTYLNTVSLSIRLTSSYSTLPIHFFSQWLSDHSLTNRLKTRTLPCTHLLVFKTWFTVTLDQNT